MKELRSRCMESGIDFLLAMIRKINRILERQLVC